MAWGKTTVKIHSDDIAFFGNNTHVLLVVDAEGYARPVTDPLKAGDVTVYYQGEDITSGTVTLPSKIVEGTQLNYRKVSDADWQHLQALYEALYAEKENYELNYGCSGLCEKWETILNAVSHLFDKPKD